jgi:putative Mg2+ transporter-C (MgtC) family protein
MPDHPAPSSQQATNSLIACDHVEKRFTIASTKLACMVGLSNQEIVLRLVIAAVLGMAIGLERERVEQPAGLRDHALVSVGSGLIMIVSAYGFQHVTQAPDVVLDPSRIAAQVITGIGFIGAGTIVLRQNVVRGLTTAASVWAAAALGLAAGGGLYFAAIIATILILAILAGIKSLEQRFFRRYRRSLIRLTVKRSGLTLQEIQKIASQSGVHVDRFDLRTAKEAPSLDRVDLLITKSDQVKLTALIDTFRAHSEVASIRSTVLGQKPARLDDNRNRGSNIAPEA